MSDVTDQRDELRSTGTDVNSALEGLGWKLEEARLHLDATGDAGEIEDGVQYAQGVYRSVAAELEELADHLRSAADPE